MKLSKLLWELKEVFGKHGDLDVGIMTELSIGEPPKIESPSIQVEDIISRVITSIRYNKTHPEGKASRVVIIGNELEIKTSMPPNCS